MAKKESTIVNMVATMFLVSLIASAALGFVYSVTKEPIQLAQIKKIKKTLEVVLPPFDEYREYKVAVEGAAKESIFRLSGLGADSLTFYEAKKDGEVVGIAIKSFTDKGFSGRFTIMAGFTPDGIIYDVDVLEHKETPGLGDKMKKAVSPWNEQFKGWNVEQNPLVVAKDGGKVNAITAATISSRAFCDALFRAYEAFKKEGGKS